MTKTKATKTVKTTTATTKQPTKKSGKAPKKKTPPAAKSPAKAKQTAGAKPKASSSKPQYPRHPKNPFRAGSSNYGKIFDILSAHKSGLPRKELIEKTSIVTGKDIKHAGYDCSVVLSARDSNTGARHRSCPEGFWIKREADHVQLMID